MDSKTILQKALHEANATGDEIIQYLQTFSGSDSTAIRDPFAPESPIDTPNSLSGPLRRLAEAANQLLQLATGPKESLALLAAQYQNLTCLRWLVNLHVLEHIPIGGKIEYSRLASLANVPESQLKGVARMAITSGFLFEPEPDTVCHSRNSTLLVKDRDFMNWARWMTNYSVPTAYKFPEATQRWGRTEAKNETAFNLAMNTQQPFFDSLRQDSEMNTMFSGYMRNVASTEGVSFKHLVNGFNWANLPDGATVVDVGGSGGHASAALAKEFPRLEFVVQDLPETLTNAKNASDPSNEITTSQIRFMSHDFFQPEPITDADVYLLRMIIHDWPDTDAVKILRNLKHALKKPGARIIIMDTVLPQPGTIPILQERQLRVRDLTMMQVFNAKERELQDWKQLLQKAGLQLLHVEQPSGSNMGILHVEHEEEKATRNDVHTSKSVLTNGHHDAEEDTTYYQGGINGTPLSATEDLYRHSTARGLGKRQLPVLIIGAGVGGLCLAQGLSKAGIDVRVFERDLSQTYRPQGYRLKFEADAAAALQDCLPAHLYRAFEASCAVSAVGETDFDPISGACIKSRSGGGLAGQQGLRASFTVDRAVFRGVLMAGLEDKIVFGKNLNLYEETEDGTVVAKFADDSRIEGSFLIGADGARSVVRKQYLPKHKFVDTGAVCIYGKTTMTPALLRQYPERALKWMTVCADTAPLIQSILIGDSPLTLLSEPIRFDATSRAQTKQLPEDYVYWVLIGSKEIFVDASEGKATEAATLERRPEESARQSLELTKEWSSSLRSLFELQDVQQCSTLRVVSATPEIPDWEPAGLVTLIGDSIHCMSPCGGVGANTAVRDAAELVRLFAGAGHEAPTAEMVGSFEKDLRHRAFPSIMRSFAGSKKMFNQRPFSELPVISA